MLKQTLLCTALITAGMIGTVSARQSSERPQVDYTLVFTGAESRNDTVDPALAAITAWLAENFDLPAADHPRVELVPPAPMRRRSAGSASTTARSQANSRLIRSRCWCARGAWAE